MKKGIGVVVVVVVVVNVLSTVLSGTKKCIFIRHTDPKLLILLVVTFFEVRK